MKPRFSYPHVQEALAEMADHLGNALFRPFLPQFVSDRFRHPVLEYLALAAKARLAERVDFIDGGDPLALMAGAMGAIVKNSTAGLHALQTGCPAKGLGMATYDIGGITHQGPLAGFWSAPHRPDPDDVAALVRVLAATIHVRGDFFSPDGRASAVAGSVALIERGAVINCPGQEAIPRRVAVARRQGISVDIW